MPPPYLCKHEPFLTLLFCCCFITALPAQVPLPSRTNQWAVRLQAGQSIETVAEDLGAEVVGPIGPLKDYYLLNFSNGIQQEASINQQIRQNKQVLWSRQQIKRELFRKNLNDPRLAELWHLNNTGQGGGTAGMDANVFAAWDLGYSGKDVQICIVDDGLDKDHDELAPNFILADSWDFNTGNGNDPSPVTGFDTHGTSCTGVAGAKGNNGIGVSGVAYDVNLAGIRLISNPVTPATEAMALTFHNNNNHIYSNSWGPFDNGTYQGADELVREALRAGAATGRNGLGSIFTWAGGNGRTNRDNTNYDGYVNSIYTIGVGAFTDAGFYSYYSEPGASLMVSAPSSGGNSSITTTYIFNGYTNGFGGTSSATPLVAGVVALMLEANPLLSWRDVQHILVESAAVIDSTDTDWTMNGVGQEINHNYGFGAVDAAAAVSLAADWEKVVPASTDTLPVLSVNEPIPDGIGTSVAIYGDSIERIIHVDRDLTLEHVELRVSIAHDYTGDIRVRLISPAGTVSVLSEAHLVGRQSFETWTYMSVRNWGESSAGDWTVLMDDGLAEFTGTWLDAQLILHGTDGSCAVSDLTIDDDPVGAGIYRTNAGISSAGIIPAYSEVAYQAGTQIVLSPGFHATAGSKFSATIATCSVPEVLTQQPREEIPMEQIAVPVTAANLRIFPNPVTENATITYALEQETEVMIELLDLNGRLMQTLQPQVQQSAGSHQLELPSGSLPAGMYVVRMRSAREQVVERVVVE